MGPFYVGCDLTALEAFASLSINSLAADLVGQTGTSRRFIDGLA